MKGFEEYLERHGSHFTVRLAMDIIRLRYSLSEIKDCIRGEVFYNVTGTTEGDMLFIVNSSYSSSLRNASRRLMHIMGDFSYYDLTVFDKWAVRKRDFDLTPYI